MRSEMRLRVNRFSELSRGVAPRVRGAGRGGGVARPRPAPGLMDVTIRRSRNVISNNNMESITLLIPNSEMYA